MERLSMGDSDAQTPTAEAEDSSDRVHNMRSVAEEFCKAFAAGMAPTAILTRFFGPAPKITEHGPAFAKTRLPFLATTFRGRRQDDGSRGGCGSRDTCDDYYDILTSMLSFHPHPDTVPPKESFLVACTRDAHGRWQGGVTIKLHASFSSIKTGRSWSEEFVYVLSEFDDETKIGHLEIWADPLSAWMAVGD